MIVGEHSVIRAAEPDDAYSLIQLYDSEHPRSFLLGPAREVMTPTRDELREILIRRDLVAGTFLVVEDKQGDVQGAAVFRGAKLESEFAEVVLALARDEAYRSPLAHEVFLYLRRVAFVDKKLNKIVSHCLSTEEASRVFLLAHGFHSDGVQRDMTYARGRYYDLEAFSLFRKDVIHELEAELDESAAATS
ncbi:MAG: GNAT family protein [Candidatus Hydrogenedentales bacterium]|jgi:RimJ/RimL family protein N-acetyltransferase